MSFQQSAENEARSFFNWDSSTDEGDRSDFVTPNSSGFIDGNAFLTPDALRETFPEDPFTDVFIDQSRITNPIRAPTFPTIVQMEQGMLNQARDAQLKGEYAHCCNICNKLLLYQSLPRHTRVETLHVAASVVSAKDAREYLKDALVVCQEMDKIEGPLASLGWRVTTNIMLAELELVRDTGETEGEVDFEDDGAISEEMWEECEEEEQKQEENGAAGRKSETGENTAWLGLNGRPKSLHSTSVSVNNKPLPAGKSVIGGLHASKMAALKLSWVKKASHAHESNDEPGTLEKVNENEEYSNGSESLSLVTNPTSFRARMMGSMGRGKGKHSI